MSFPNIPNVSATINLERSSVINLLLASIAFEELGLAHVINAEAEKIQFVLGTLPDQTTVIPPTISNLIAIDESVARLLKLVAKNQMLLEFKLEEIPPVTIPPVITVFTDTATVTATFDDTIVTDSDSANYHTITI